MAEETAQYYLRNAVAAFDKAKAKASTDDLRGAWVDIFRLVNYAMEDISKAKAIDATATIDIGPTPTSPHSLVAALLLFEANVSTTEGLPEKTIRSGIAAFKKYLSYDEGDHDARCRLSLAYLKVYEREHAIDTINEVLRGDPANLEARKIRDTIKADPNLGKAFSPTQPYMSETPSATTVPQEPEYENPTHNWLFALNFVALFLIFVIALNSLRGEAFHFTSPISDFVFSQRMAVPVFTISAVTLLFDFLIFMEILP